MILHTEGVGASIFPLHSGDIACIDQRSEDPRSAADIGRQAVIFKGAKAVFAWLSSLSHSVLDQQIFKPLNSFLEQLGKLAGPDQVYISTADLKQARDCLVRLFQDAWFSSLWTLQKVFLRYDAIILSHEADTFAWPYPPGPDLCMSLFSLLDYGDALTLPEFVERGLAPKWYSCLRRLGWQILPRLW